MSTQPSQVVVCAHGNPVATDATHRSPEENDHKRPQWGRVIAVKILRTRPKSFPWSENLIAVVKAIRDSSSAIPIPYIQPAAAIVLLILEVVQSANRNEQDLKELTTGLVGIIKSIQTTLAAHCTVYDAPPSYLRQCEEFISMLSEMLIDLSHVVHKHKSWTRFFRTAETHDRIAYWRRQIDDQRNNFTMMTVMNINLKLYALPRGLGYTWESSKPLRLVDAMNITIDLPVVLCSNKDDFHDLLSFLFRKRRGRSFVDRGQYNLTMGESDSGAPTILTAAQWPSLVKPGSSIDMNIVLRHNGLDENDGRQCPSCKHLCSGASLGEDVTCPSCQTMFRVSRAIIEELEEAEISPTESPRRPLAAPSLLPSNPTRASDPSSTRSENLSTPSRGVLEQSNEALDVHYFRRFHVIVDTHDTGKLRNGPHRSSSLNNGASSRFEHSGRMEKLDKAIAHHRAALALLPAGHPDRPYSLRSLANGISSRFKQSGRTEDLEEVITYRREALALCPPDHPDRSHSLRGLANGMSYRFNQSGRMEDLEEAITYRREALALCPPGHPDRSYSLRSLANGVSSRFEHSGRMDDLDEAIAYHREALALLPPGHPDRSDSLRSLANGVSSRFEHSGRMDDLDEANAYHREAVALYPPGHPGYSHSLRGLANGISSRFKQSGRMEDLEEAITYYREALALLPADHPDRSYSLHSLANGISSRFKQSGRMEDLEEVITYRREAFALCPPGHPTRSYSLDNLANALFTRFKQSGRTEDLEEAITYRHQELALRPSHPEASSR